MKKEILARNNRWTLTQGWNVLPAKRWQHGNPPLWLVCISSAHQVLMVQAHTFQWAQPTTPWAVEKFGLILILIIDFSSNQRTPRQDMVIHLPASWWRWWVGTYQWQLLALHFRTFSSARHGPYGYSFTDFQVIYMHCKLTYDIIFYAFFSNLYPRHCTYRIWFVIYCMVSPLTITVDPM